MRGASSATGGMTDTLAPTLPRDALFKALNGDKRLVAAFEQQAQVVQETQQQAGDTVAATSALQDATFITLSPNETLTGERVLKVGPGISIATTDDAVTLSVSDEVPHVSGGFAVQMIAQGRSTLILPLAGTLATRSGEETLNNKTLASPLLDGIGDYADDTAAAAGGVAVGGIYRTGSVLKVRVA